MSHTKVFREQHDELLKLATDVSRYLSADTLAKDAAGARTALSKLLGKLKVHLAMEDKSLYPRLVQHADTKVQTVAKRYISEMGGIQKVVDDYHRAWPSSGAIEKDPNGFISQTKSIFAALTKRIDKENKELYKLADEA